MRPPRGVRACVIRHIVGFGGQPVDELVVADHRREPGRRVGQRQRAVVEAGATAEPRPGAVDGEGGHEHQRRGRDGVGGQPRRRRLAQPISRFDQPVHPILAPVQRQRHARGILPGHREEHPHPECRQGLDRRDRSRLRADGHVRADGLARGDQRQEMACQRMRLGVVHRCGRGAASRKDRGRAARPWTRWARVHHDIRRHPAGFQRRGRG